MKQKPKQNLKAEDPLGRWPTFWVGNLFPFSFGMFPDSKILHESKRNWNLPMSIESRHSCTYIIGDIRQEIKD